jgi:hypothetical protein
MSFPKVILIVILMSLGPLYSFAFNQESPGPSGKLSTLLNEGIKAKEDNNYRLAKRKLNEFIERNKENHSGEDLTVALYAYADVLVHLDDCKNAEKIYKDLDLHKMIQSVTTHELVSRVICENDNENIEKLLTAINVFQEEEVHFGPKRNISLKDEKKIVRFLKGRVEKFFRGQNEKINKDNLKITHRMLYWPYQNKIQKKILSIDGNRVKILIQKTLENENKEFLGELFEDWAPFLPEAFVEHWRGILTDQYVESLTEVSQEKFDELEFERKLSRLFLIKPDFYLISSFENYLMNIDFDNELDISKGVLVSKNIISQTCQSNIFERALNLFLIKKKKKEILGAIQNYSDCSANWTQNDWSSIDEIFYTYSPIQGENSDMKFIEEIINILMEKNKNIESPAKSHVNLIYGLNILKNHYELWSDNIKSQALSDWQNQIIESAQWVDSKSWSQLDFYNQLTISEIILRKMKEIQKSEVEFPLVWEKLEKWEGILSLSNEDFWKMHVAPEMIGIFQNLLDKSNFDKESLEFQIIQKRITLIKHHLPEKNILTNFQLKFPFNVGFLPSSTVSNIDKENSNDNQAEIKIEL